jgi:hypothetical protein
MNIGLLLLFLKKLRIYTDKPSVNQTLADELMRRLTQEQFNKPILAPKSDISTLIEQSYLLGREL